MPSFTLVCIIITCACGLGTFISVDCWTILFQIIFYTSVCWPRSEVIPMGCWYNLYMCWVHFSQSIHIVDYYESFVWWLLLNGKVMVMIFAFFLTSSHINIFQISIFLYVRFCYSPLSLLLLLLFCRAAIFISGHACDLPCVVLFGAVIVVIFLLHSWSLPFVALLGAIIVVILVHSCNFYIVWLVCVCFWVVSFMTFPSL